ncbi:MAG: PD-(D/E)XK nuclease family protein [Actinobacteria bacterium]|nr:MAG: PD-(D/E)XK nuclease family protein [Actinomycetota bacterium]RIK08601.1 MAG: PD-(D/E)XK nuclease family protein [Acidobacteriota bacterium]
MPLKLPSSLSPSKVSSFKDCALAFRFSAIDRLPEPASEAATRGTLVHRALEMLLCAAPSERTEEHARLCLDQAFSELRTDDDYLALELDTDQQDEFIADAADLVSRYFELEDPSSVQPIGLELRLEVEVADHLTLRGIIDRLELDERGQLVVTDYKTGKVPGRQFEQARLGGVHFYSYLCERFFGQRPARVQLLYLSAPEAIITEPTAQSTRGLERRLEAIWSAIERACERDDFRPSPSRLCDYCNFRQYCPAFGGDPALAGTEHLETTPA